MIDALRISVRRCAVICALALAAVALTPAAHAESVQLAAGFMQGSGKLSSDTDLEMAVAGKLTIQVTDLGVPLTIFDRLASLSFSLTDSTGIFASKVGEGTLSVNITNPGTYGLHIIGMPDHSRYSFTNGVVSWNATFDPLAPVPLPGSFWLLIAGAAWAIGLQRKRARLAVQESGGLLSGCTRLALAH